MDGSFTFQSGIGIGRLLVVSDRPWLLAGEEVAFPEGLPPKQQVTEATKSSVPKTQEGQRQKASGREDQESRKAAASPPPVCTGPLHSTRKEARFSLQNTSLSLPAGKPGAEKPLALPIKLPTFTS